MNLLDEKDVAERITVSFGFSAALDAGETLTGAPAVTASVYLGQDSAPASVLTGAASIVGANVLQAVTGGIAVTDYELKAVCATSAGRILAVIAILPVR